MTAYQIIGDRAAILRLAPQMVELADKYNLPPPRAIAGFMAGWARACGTELGAGLHIMETEFARVSTMTPLPQFYAGLLASVRLAAGQPERALEPLDATLNAVTEPGVGAYLPEIHRLRGECLLRFDPPRFGEAVAEFETGIAIAKQQQARAFQLRAAMSLARAFAATGTPDKGVTPLHEAVGAFNAEDDYPEIATARQFLAAASH